jgi:hypothetical protein
MTCGSKDLVLETASLGLFLGRKRKRKSLFTVHLHVINTQFGVGCNSFTPRKKTRGSLTLFVIVLSLGLHYLIMTLHRTMICAIPHPLRTLLSGLLLPLNCHHPCGLCLKTKKMQIQNIFVYLLFQVWARLAEHQVLQFRLLQCPRHLLETRGTQTMIPRIRP